MAEMPDATPEGAGDAGSLAPRTRERVLALAAYGVPEEGIARLLGLAPAMLRERFADGLARGSAEANLKVAQSLFRKATGDGPQGVVAAIFWLKSRAGWRDRPDPELDELGKKERRRLATEAAGLDSEWGDDLAWIPAAPTR
jgi:hypothetical protein